MVEVQDKYNQGLLHQALLHLSLVGDKGVLRVSVVLVGNQAVLRVISW